MPIVRRCVAALAGMAIAASLLTNAGAQGLSGGLITIIVPFTPGTGPDILARFIGEEIQQRWGHPVIVENKPGATGNVGTQLVAHAAPDGHTLLMTSNPLTSNVSLMQDVPYDPIRSFAPIIEVGVASLALAVHPSIPATSVPELVEYLKARPGQINYSSPGIGGPHHLAMELFKLRTHVDVRHIPYKGSAGALQDLVAGQVSLGFVPLHTSLGLARQGALRFLAVASKERLRIAPDIPTFSEEGLAGFEAELWYGLLAPAATPPGIVVRYNSLVNDILASPAIMEKLDKVGLLPLGGSPERLRDFLADDLVKWQRVVAEAGITAD